MRNAVGVRYERNNSYEKRKLSTEKSHGFVPMLLMVRTVRPDGLDRLN